MHVSQEKLKKLLLENNILNEAKFKDLADEADDSKVNLLSLVVSKKLATEKEVAKLYGREIGIPFADLADVQVPKETLKKLPEKIARRYNAVIFGKDEDGRYQLAMSDPEDIQAVQFIKKELGRKFNIFISTKQGIDLILGQYKEEFSEEISRVIAENREISIEEGLGEETTADSVREIVQEAPIARAVNIILEYAVKSRASDVHIEPRETFIQVRYRIDGLLRDTMTLPNQIMSSVVTRIKILANLRIDEHRIPQDGRIKLKMAGKNISLRVSTLPVMDGEKVVMRILDESTKAASLSELGFRGLALEVVKRNLDRPHGMTLVTGPTGSGKSTTLYSLLTLINDIGVNISTVEDPVEYRIPGVNQTQVNPAIGMTFASGLRALLRQDPDIIMVGEIRDKETAEMAVHASLTGHVVLSTLHTNSAPGSLPRLEDMEVEPFLIASTVNSVIGQRLVRRLCPDCKEKIKLDGKLAAKIIAAFNLKKDYAVLESKEKERRKLKSLGLEKKDEAVLSKDLSKKTILEILQENPAILNKISGQDEEIRHRIFEDSDVEEKDLEKTGGKFELNLFKPVGCPKCEQTGYKGRVGIYEVIEVDDEIGGMIIKKASEEELVSEARKSGFISMHQDGLTKAMEGITSIEEIMRATQE